MEIVVLIAIFSPLLGFLFSGILGHKLNKTSLGLISSGSILVSFICAITLFNQIQSNGLPISVHLFDWLKVGTIVLSFNFYIDQLSVWMMLFVTGIGFLIHIYSIGYMIHDIGFYKFFAYLNLFIFSMLILILGGNYLLLFFGWEGVGLCSYLLIGFWYKNASYGYAARKAFVMNRIGDLGLLLALFVLIQNIGSLDYEVVFSKVSNLSTQVITTICILLFVGAIGKSAQLPLFTWLPDAMAGPTPVSALIHAATMVTAGIYLVVRSHHMFSLSPIALQVVLMIGLSTAIVAGFIGLRQNDIKKVLAYSTVSQLGYMFVALGVGAYSTAIFHVTTHAFFKALLFLGSGSVIHAMSGEQDIRKMGGLAKYLKITHITFLIGTLAITGVPFFAGFFSKDEILTKVYQSGNMITFVLLAIASVVTAIYMFRVYFLTFWGSFRGTDHQKEHLHESPITMTLPLIILSILSIFGGALGLSSLFSEHHYLNHWLSKIGLAQNSIHPSHLFEYTMLIVSLLVLLVIVIWSWYNYVKRNAVPKNDDMLSGFEKVINRKFYIDELYDLVLVNPIQKVSKLVLSVINNIIIDGIVNSFGKITMLSGKTLTKIQNGNVERYLLAMVLGSIFLLLITLIF